ncbi:MAG: phosphoribosyl-ATP diphosphatase [Pseudomonadota bacterium]
MSEVLQRLETVIVSRLGADPESSYTASLLAKGPAKCAEKFGEEAVEAVIEAVRGDTEALTREAADVIYHLLVVLAVHNIPVGNVLDELQRREGISGLAEKAARKG